MNNTIDNIEYSSPWVDILPQNMFEVIKSIDSILHAHQDTIVMSVLSVLPSLCNGTTVAQQKDAEGKPIIIYAMLLAPTGVGKSSSCHAARKYLLAWRDHELQKSEATNIKSGKKTADIFLDGASAEGLEETFRAGSTPHMFIDEFGKFAKVARTDNVKANLLRLIMQTFDSGSMITRKLKDSSRTQMLTAKGMGLFAASTIGSSNLSPKDIKELLSDGFLNRFLIVFGNYKDIPIRQELNLNEIDSIELFAKNFYRCSCKKHFHFDDEAFSLYIDFHQKTNMAYKGKFFGNDDTAGFEVRLLTIVQRIATIFQICLDVSMQNTKNETISTDSLSRAIKLIDYLYEKHFSLIQLYANSQNGKVSIVERIKHQIQKKDGVVIRDIVRNLSGISTNEVTKIVSKLITDGWAYQDKKKLIFKSV